MTSNQRVLSVDLGKSGATIEWVGSCPTDIRDHGTLSHADWVELFKRHRGGTMVVEDVHAMPTGVKANFSMGSQLGYVEGMARAHRLSVVRVRPQRWKTDLGFVTRSGANQKAEAREKARVLYPRHADALTRVLDHNRADALLIGHWFLNHHEVTP